MIAYIDTTILFLRKAPKRYIEEKTTSSTLVFGKLDIHK
jgi:hypothetical protein